MAKNATTERLAGLVRDWPVLDLTKETISFTSYDRTGGNDDGFTGAYSSLYVDAKGEFVIVDVEQPGCLRTLWFTSGEGGYALLDLGKIRFYVDLESEPIYEVEANELFSGRAAGFPIPLVANNRASTGGFACHVPIPFSQGLRITTEKKPFFMGAYVDVWPHGTEVQSWSPTDDLSSWIELFSVGENPTGRAKAASCEGRGVIRSLCFLPDSPMDDAALRHGTIRIWWDGRPEPDVDCQLGAFFGCGLGLASVRSLAWTMDADRMENRFPMPFWSGFRIEVSGASGRIETLVDQNPWAEHEAGRFCARWSEERPPQEGHDFTYLDSGATGHWVGTVLSVEPEALQKQWWEGDLRVRLSGLRTPSIHGTGHEDDHLGGWSNEFLDTPFSLPLHGEPRVDMLDKNGQFNGRCALYRLWPSVPFVGGIRVSVEHGTENVVGCDYAGAAFWYATEAFACLETDRFDPCNDEPRAAHVAKGQNESDVFELSSAFEGEGYQMAVTARHRSHLNRLAFTMKVDPDAEWTVLRRVYDQFHGRQRARVLVDGLEVGVWYSAFENRSCRWAERDLVIPRRFFDGKPEVRVEIDPPPGTPLWDASEYRLIAVRRV